MQADTDAAGLAGLRVLVTGASGHIGAGIARRLAEAGARVALHYNRGEEAAKRLGDAIGSSDLYYADLGDAEAIAELAERARPDLLVNNAAVQDVQALDRMSLADWRRMQAINLDAAFELSQCVARSWQSAGSTGAIVNIASIEGLDPAPGHAHYAASKAGLIMLTRAMALEFGPAGIRVNAVSPGLIDREGLAEAWPDGVRRWRERVPLGSLGTPKDVADAVLFLLSPAARWISGANLVVDGGMSAQGRF